MNCFYAIMAVSMFLDFIKDKALFLKREVVVAYFIYRHPKTPLFSKALLFIALGYALSPIDFIPDAVPILGYLDDIIVLSGLVYLAIILVPREVIEEARKQEEENVLNIKVKQAVLFAVMFVFVWTIVLCAFGFFLVRFIAERI